MRVLLAAGARADQRANNGATALHWAAQTGCEDSLVLLLQSPAVAMDCATHDGITALHCAAGTDQGNTVQLLVVAGANLTLQDAAGHTPLQMAANRGQVSAVEVLMQHSTAVALVDTAATADFIPTLDATKKQAVQYKLARKAADMDPAATAAAAAALQQDLMQIFLRALGDAGTAKDQALAAAEATNIQQERTAVQHLIVSMASVSKQAQADLAQLQQQRTPGRPQQPPAAKQQG